ncbi:hypothetical protein CJ738_35755, partial [Klebsiella pneumoniae]
GEFAVLKALVSHPREPLSRDKLMNLAAREYSAMSAHRRTDLPPAPHGEFAVLKALVSHPREPLSRDKLMNLAAREYSAM